MRPFLKDFIRETFADMVQFKASPRASASTGSGQDSAEPRQDLQPFEGSPAQLHEARQPEAALTFTNSATSGESLHLSFEPPFPQL